MSRYFNISAVKVPNPLAMKFSVEGVMLTEGAWQFQSEAEAAAGSPLARKFFGFDYIGQVFISRNFVTLTQKDAQGPIWESVLPDLRIILRKHLEAGEPILQVNDVQDAVPPQGTELEEAIRAVIENQIRPATRQDGGDMTFDRFENGTVWMKLAGACVGCPFGPRTLKAGVEVLLKRHFPEVETVSSADIDWSETQEN